jgi:ankyrin repeat protein
MQLGRTPLYCAAEKGLKHIVSVLLDSGADTEAKDFIVRPTFYYAVMR